MASGTELPPSLKPFATEREEYVLLVGKGCYRAICDGGMERVLESCVVHGATVSVQ